MPSWIATFSMRLRHAPERLAAGLRALALVAALLAGNHVARAAAPAGARATYTGCCDASAATGVTPELFAAGSDEDNVLRLYRRDAGGAPVAAFNVSGFLGVGRGDETDLEACALVGSRVYWIGSHSRNSDGKARPARHVLFATDVRGTGTNVALAPVGRPWGHLVAELARQPETAALGISAAAARAGEDPGGLNIEGLAAGPEGALWIGFRNPVPDGLALMVPLLNPDEVLLQAAAPRFATGLRADLGGLGIRDLARRNDGRGWWILAGPAEGGGRHRLFRWDGPGSTPLEVPQAVPKGFQAEGLVTAVPPGPETLLTLLGDEGGEKVGGRRCEELADFSQRRFRTLRVPVP